MQGIGFAIVGAIARILKVGPFAHDDELDGPRGEYRPAVRVGVVMRRTPSPRELFAIADGDPVRYLELLHEHGLIVPNDPCPRCGARTRHRHDGRGQVIPVDVFGHDQR